MKLLSDILYKAGIIEVMGATNIVVADVCFDSRKVKKDSLFVAIKGIQLDGHEFIMESIDRGAIAVVCEDLPAKTEDNIIYIKVKNSSVALGYISSNFYDNPATKLKLVGVTGTNGKTTTVTLLFNLFRTLGYEAGLVSTVNNFIGDEEIPPTHTTPDALQTNMLLKKMVDRKCTHCFMEVSSHAIVQNRIAGLEFTGGVFTNITHEHLDYHKSFDEYIYAKKQFFDQLSSEAFALINKDDKHGEVMLQNTKAVKKMYSMRSMADFKCKIIENQFSGLLLNIDGKEVWTMLAGSFNAYNLLVAYATALLLKEEKLDVLTALSSLNPVEGRFELVKTDSGIIGIVDYAHTPDALKNILDAVNRIRTGNETLITVVGCGGDRDVQKRPEMARIACEKSDRVILTSDNPRSEEPEAIIKDMLKGVEPMYFNKVISIADRREAIKTACSIACPSGRNEHARGHTVDIILVAGKGHEKYQEIKGVKHPFYDKVVLMESCKMISNQ
ncbi:MAG: UDP-N-acetylmuramoyl-L-alanyl-D-glutamate--2,6-diaminopimelate ligase [Bacteroidota bacterium]